MLKLIIEDDEGRKTVVPFAREEITIGRQEGNTIRLTERNVSRRHARLLRQNGHVLIEDLGSYNGIRVNGDRISGQVQVADGDLIQIGDYDLALQAEQVDTGPLGESGPRASSAQKLAETRKMPDPYAATATVPMLPAVTVPMPAVPEPAEPRAEAQDSGFPEPLGVPKSQSTAVIRIDQLEGAERKRAVVDIDVAEAPRLVVLTTDFAGKDFPCTRSELRVGRTDDNDIVIDHRSLSRTHCKLVREDNGEWRVIDMQSANGLMVNGESYAQVTLRRGDVLELGHVKLKFVGPTDDVALPSASTSNVTLETASGGSKAPLIALVAAGLVILLGIGGYALWKGGQGAGPAQPTAEQPPRAGQAGDAKATLAQKLTDARAAIAALDWARAQQLLEGCQLDGALHPEAKAMLAQLDAEKGFKAALVAAAAALDAGDLDTARAQLDAASETTLLKARYEELSARRADEVKKRLAVAPREPAKKDPPVAPGAQGEASKQAEAEALLAEAAELSKSKSYEAAQKRLKRCIELAPRFHRCYKLLGSVYARIANRNQSAADTEQARVHYQRFLELAPPDDPDVPRVRKILAEAANQ